MENRDKHTLEADMQIIKIQLDSNLWLGESGPVKSSADAKLFTYDEAELALKETRQKAKTWPVFPYPRARFSANRSSYA